MARLRAGARTDRGRVRVSNQDAFLTSHSVFAVADGMGGHAGGEVASRIAVHQLEHSRPTTVQALVEAVRAANQRIHEEAASSPLLHGMGTTLCALGMVRDGDHAEMVVVNVGDSRVYVVQEGSLLQITRDHSFVEDLVAAGEITPEEARTHPRRNILTRALGVDAQVEVDIWEVTPYPGDRYLLCSDGLFNELSDDEIAGVLRSIKDPQSCAHDLVERALAAGARDNVTAMVVDVLPDDPLVVDEIEPELGNWLQSPPEGPALMLDAPLVGVTPPPPEGAAPGLTDKWLVSAADEFDQPTVTDSPASGPPTAQVPVVQRRRTAGNEPTARRDPLFTWRVVSFLGLVAVTVTMALAAITVYARAGYTVGVDGTERIVISKGRPGGLLWFHPTFVENGQFGLSQLPEAEGPRLKAGIHVGSLVQAEQFICQKYLEKVAQTSGLNASSSASCSNATPLSPTITGGP